MLKIKDDVDLKELEKFGFAVRYDEYTGKQTSYKIKIIKNEGSCRVIVTISIRDRSINVIGDIECLYEEILFKFFELITAGLVEKVGE